MHEILVMSVKCGDILEMMYADGKGQISKRRIKVLMVGDTSFRAFCYLRKTKRTFTIDNVLAIVPVVQKESMVI